MDKCISKFTVYFDNPFWVGVYERQSGNVYEVCKITFGSEPKDCEVYEFILKYWKNFIFSPPIESVMRKERKINPKRMQRNINRELHQGIGTKAQQALKLHQEQRKQIRKNFKKEINNSQADYRFALKQQKKKAKHKGH